MPDRRRPPSDPRVQPPATSRTPRGVRLAALPLALAAATGVVAGALLTVAAGGVGSTLASPSPAAPDLAVRWSSSAVFPEAILAAAVNGIGVTVGALALVTLMVALSAAATLLTAVGSLRRRELAVRGALGVGLRELAGLLVRRDGAVLLRGLLAGALAGVAAAALLHAAWPVARADGPFVPVGPTLLGVAGAGALCLLVGVALTTLPARYGVRGLARSLAAGSRATADPREGGLRRVATVLQTTVGLALLSASLLLWRALPAGDGPDPGPAGDPGDELVLLSASTPDPPASTEERAARYEDFLRRLASASTVASESIASPGAWTGVATSDFVLADCGNCRRGMFWLPLLGEEARHHAVSPGFFGSAGMELLEGRDFTLADDVDGAPVAVVTEPMARANFEDGDPLGRRVRIGRGMEGWHTVVGVVRERRTPGLGVPDGPVPGVYLSALQHPPRQVEVAFRIRSGGVPAGASSEVPDPLADVRAAATAAGLVPAREPRAISALRRERAAPLVWAAASAGGLGLVALLSALLGVHRVAAVEVAARRRELGIRLALGATSRGLTRWVLARTLRSSLLGALLAVPPTVAIAARLRETVGGVPLFDAPVFGALATLLVAAALLGASGPARSAARLEPALVMSEE